MYMGIVGRSVKGMGDIVAIRVNQDLRSVRMSPSFILCRARTYLRPRVSVSNQNPLNLWTGLSL